MLSPAQGIGSEKYCITVVLLSPGLVPVNSERCRSWTWDFCSVASLRVLLSSHSCLTYTWSHWMRSCQFEVHIISMLMIPNYIFQSQANQMILLWFFPSSLYPVSEGCGDLDGRNRLWLTPGKTKWLLDLSISLWRFSVFNSAWQRISPDGAIQKIWAQL